MHKLLLLEFLIKCKNGIEVSYEGEKGYWVSGGWESVVGDRDAGAKSGVWRAKSGVVARRTS